MRVRGVHLLIALLCACGTTETSDKPVLADPPTGVTAVAGNGEATVSWDPSTGGARPTGYEVIADPGGQTVDAPWPETSATVTGLKNGTSYTFEVLAFDPAGPSFSKPSNAVTPLGPPDAPLNVSAIAGDAQATVSWDPPASNGGSTVTSYTVTADPGGANVTVEAPATRATLSGLSNGTGYTFTLVAANALGASPPSAPSAAVTPATTPGAPKNVSADPGDAEAIVSWNAPDSDGGNGITGYTVTTTPGGQTATVSAPATSATITGLTNGTSYAFTVLASNALGSGPPSDSVTAVPFSPLSATRSSLTASPENLPVDTTPGVVITFVARRADGTPMAGLAVTFTSTEGSDVITPASGVADAAGKLTATLSGSIAGRRTVTAQADALSWETPVSLTAAICEGVSSYDELPEVRVGRGTFAAMTTADFDGDGNVDLAAASNFASSISVALSNGDGTFRPTVAYAVAAAPSSVTAADLNGDGAIDLVVTMGSINTFDVLLGNGDGTFQPATPYSASYGASAVAVSDYNEDGVPDLAMTTNGGVAFLAGNGDGSFRTPVSTSVGSGSSQVASGDFNHDGHIDLAVTLQYVPWGASILLGNGDGSFQSPVEYGSSGQAVSIVTADLNEDGATDLILANDGPEDQLNNFSVLLGNADGTFQAAANYGAGGPQTQVLTGDFDEDGHVDVALVANSYSGGADRVTVLHGNRDGTFTPGFTFAEGRTPMAGAVADFDNDGHLDLAVAFSAETVGIFPGLGDGTFQTLAGDPVGRNAEAIASADFNRDGLDDLGVVTQDGTLGVFLANSDGSFSLAASYPTGGTAVSIASGDFNADGRPDLAVVNYGQQAVVLFLGAGDGSFGALSVPLPAPAYAVTSSDFDQDGWEDLAVATGSPGPSGATLLLGNGDGTFRTRSGPSMSAQTLTSADLNGDGVPDLVGHNGLGAVDVSLGNGDGSFQTPTSFRGGQSSQTLAVGDLNADGKPDLVVGDSSSADSLNVFVGNGDGTFQPGPSYPSDGEPVSLVIRDLDGDGRPDVASAGPDLAVFPGNGDGTLGDPTFYGAGAFPMSVTTGDFNGDGEPDVALANETGAFAVLRTACTP